MHFLLTLEKFNNIREIKDLIEDLKTLHKYFYSKEYDKMQEHILKIMIKYYVEDAMI